MTQYIACGSLGLTGNNPLFIVSVVKLHCISQGNPAFSLTPHYVRSHGMPPPRSLALAVPQALEHFFGAAMTREQIEMAHSARARLIVPLQRGAGYGDKVAEVVERALNSLGAKGLPFDVLVPDGATAACSPPWILTLMHPGYLVLRSIPLGILRGTDGQRHNITLNPMVESETAGTSLVDSFPIRIIDEALRGEDQEQLIEMCRALAKQQQRLIIIAPSIEPLGNISLFAVLIQRWLDSIGVHGLQFEILAWG